MTNTIARRAKALQTVERDGQTGWLYEWNTGEFALLIEPENFSFDPTRSAVIKAPVTSGG